MTKIALIGGRVVDPAAQLDTSHDIAIVDGKIIASGPTLPDFTADQTLDVTGSIICPGLVDMNATILSAESSANSNFWQQLQDALKAGITHVGTYAFFEDRGLELAEIEYYARRPASYRASAQPCLIGPLTQHLQGTRLSELQLLRNVGCVAFTNGQQPLINTLVKRRCYDYAAMLGHKIFIEAQDPYLSQNGFMHEGEVSLRLGVTGIPSLAETVALSQELLLVEATQVHAHFRHLTVAKSAQLLSMSQQAALPVTADVSLAHLFLTDIDVQLDNGITYIRPPLRPDSDRRALRQALRDGVITTISSDHQQLPLVVKELPFQDALPGMSTWPVLLPLVLRLAQEMSVPLLDALAWITCAPAKILGIDAGHLAVNKVANLIVFDPQEEWQLQDQDLDTFGHNSPFNQWQLQGKIQHVIAQGQMIF